jgi:hypothetical protein
MNHELQNNLIEAVIAKKDELDNHPAAIIGITPSRCAYILLTVAEGSPCAQEMQRELRRILGRKDFYVRRHPMEDYRRGNGTHDYLLVGLGDTAASILDAYMGPPAK